MQYLLDPAIVVTALFTVIGTVWYLRGLFADISKRLDDQGRQLDNLTDRVQSLEGRMGSLEGRMGNVEVMLATLLQLARRDAKGDEDEDSKS